MQYAQVVNRFIKQLRWYAHGASTSQFRVPITRIFAVVPPLNTKHPKCNNLSVATMLS